MSFIRKTSRLGSSTLSAHQSPYNASVVILSASTSSATSPQRSGRLQSTPSAVHEHAQQSEKAAHTEMERDIEDVAGTSKSEGKVKPLVSGRKRKEAAVTSTTSPRKAKAIRLALDVPHPTPDNWKETYAAIKEMRKDGGAPVDEMGCHMAGGPVADPKTKRFVILVSLMLSSQTKDEVTHAAVSNLRTSLGELTVENVLAAEETVISDAIGKVGFWRRKTQYIKQASRKIQDEFDGEIPNTVDGLCSLPGVGPKMAFLALQVAWNLNVGIGVDVHVHRITNRLGWHKPPTKEPEQTRLNLQSWLPADLHGEINPLLVGFGQTICLPVGPRCDVCTLSTKGLCPSAKTGIKSKARKIAVKGAAMPKVTLEVEETIVKSEDKISVPEVVKLEEGSVDNGSEGGVKSEEL